MHFNVFENLIFSSQPNPKEDSTWTCGVYEAITWNTSTKTLLNCDINNEKEGKTELFVVVLCLHTGNILANLRPSEVQHCVVQ